MPRNFFVGRGHFLSNRAMLNQFFKCAAIVSGQRVFILHNKMLVEEVFNKVGDCGDRWEIVGFYL